MELPGSLQTIAEISIGLAGFSGLIVALRKDLGTISEIQKYRLQILLSLSFGALFLSLLPELLLSFEVGIDGVWKLSSICLSFYSVLFLTWWISASRRIKITNAEIFNWFAFSRMVAGHIVVLLVQLAFIFSILDIAGAAAYSLALVWYLLHSAQQFTRMLFFQPKGVHPE